MKTILAFAIGGAALFGVASSANAQDCVGGYMMLKDQIPIRCDVGPGPEQIGIAPVQPLPESSMTASAGGGNADQIPVASGSEPLFTGSITPSAAEPTGVSAGGGNADELPSATSNRMDDSCWIETANTGVTLPRPCN